MSRWWQVTASSKEIIFQIQGGSKVNRITGHYWHVPMQMLLSDGWFSLDCFVFRRPPDRTAKKIIQRPSLTESILPSWQKRSYCNYIFQVTEKLSTEGTTRLSGNPEPQNQVVYHHSPHWDPPFLHRFVQTQETSRRPKVQCQGVKGLHCNHHSTKGFCKQMLTMQVPQDSWVGFVCFFSSNKMDWSGFLEDILIYSRVVWVLYQHH